MLPSKLWRLRCFEKGLEVDYGNEEYAILLELLSLLEPELLVSLNSMRSSWRTYLALWIPNRTRAHLERLEDIIAIIMAALPADSWRGRKGGEARIGTSAVCHQRYRKTHKNG